MMNLMKVLFYKVLENQPPLPVEKTPQEQLPPETVPEIVPEPVPEPVASAPVVEAVPEPVPEPSQFNPFAAISNTAEAESTPQPSKKSKK